MAAAHSTFRRPMSAAGPRSRFHEGSMNDRASAMPPLDFLGPEDVEMLERPLHEECQYYYAKQQQKHQLPQHPQSQPQKRSTLFGQVWEGVCGRLRLKRDDHKEKDGYHGIGKEREKTRNVMESLGVSPMRDDRPSREQVLANYQELVDNGFFMAHAIQSSRQPPPGSKSTPLRPASSPSPSTARSVRMSLDSNVERKPKGLGFHTRSQSDQTHHLLVTPKSPSPDRERQLQWPLSSPTRPPPSPPTMLATPPHPKMATLTPPAPVTSPFRSPGSVSSRGTKRGADEELFDPPTPNKKLRKSSSREIAIPKLRRVTRSFSSSTRNGGQAARRVFARLPARASVDVLPRRSSRIHDAYAGNRSFDNGGSMGTKVLRQRRSAIEPLSVVVPDANRGIPNVPDIPTKWIFGGERELTGSWRSRIR